MYNERGYNTMTKPMVNRKKGEYAVELGGSWHVLKGSFSNIALFEDNVMGVYQFADKVSTGEVRMTDVVNVIYCFQKDRENGLDQDGIAELVISDEPRKSIEAIAGFMGVLFAVADMDSNDTPEEEDPTKKK